MAGHRRSNLAAVSTAVIAMAAVVATGGCTNGTVYSPNGSVYASPATPLSAPVVAASRRGLVTA